MNISKYILILVAVLLFPIMGYAQKIGGGKYVVSTKDTTSIVSNRGAKDPRNEFLFRKKGPEADSIYDAIRSKYTNLENAILDVDGLITEIENDRDLLKMGNTSLAYRLSRANIESREKEKRARIIADSLQQEMMKKSAEELAQRYARYGDKPSYFVNGVQVQPELISQFTQGDIVTRNMKIEDNGIGNPNGEIWITVTNKAARKFNLPGLETNTESNTYTPAPSVITVPSHDNNLRRGNVQPQPATNTTKAVTPKVENTKKKEKSPKRSVRRIKADREEKSDNKPATPAPAYQPAPVQTPPAQSQTKPAEQKRVEPQQQKATTQPQTVSTQQTQPQQSQQNTTEQKAESTVKPVENNPQPQTGGRKTIVRARTVNNEEVSTKEPVDSDSDSLD